MNNHIIKKLLDLNKIIVSLGAYKEANYIYNLIKKSTPLLDIVKLYDEKEESDFSLFENQEAWSGSIKRIGPNVVVIPFDENKLSDKDKKRIMKTWEFVGDNFQDFKNRTSLVSPPSEFQMEKSNKLTPISKLQAYLPDLWKKIKASLGNLDAEEAVYILYNVKSIMPELAAMQFAKTPRYLAHDLGHWTYDLSRKDKSSPDWTDQDQKNFDSRTFFKKKVNEFMKNISKFYVDTNGASPKLDDRNLGLFFKNIISPEDDRYSDLFANAISEEGIQDTYINPEKIVFKNKEYRLITDNLLSEKESLEKKFFKEITRYVSDPKDGPLSDAYGQVIFYDVL